MVTLNEAERNALSITRMIFHVVGHSLAEPILLEEIAPPQQTDFFIERIKSALRGNQFEFMERSDTEARLRDILENPDHFAESSRQLAVDFQSRHTGATTSGAFFLFELTVGDASPIFAMIKYDNDDVVRYVIADGGGPIVPQLERFQESFVRKPDAMQKVALVRLSPDQGGMVAVRDRSNLTHISDYFQGFLRVRRINEPAKLTAKFVNALKATFKDHKDILPDDVRKGGVGRLLDTLRQGRHVYDSENPEPLLTAAFGALPPDSPVRRALIKRLKEEGIVDETFEITADHVERPRKRRLDTEEGTYIVYDEENAPDLTHLSDGRTEIKIVTRRITGDDVDAEGRPPRRRG